jgi:hypothetical protein
MARQTGREKERTEADKRRRYGETDRQREWDMGQRQTGRRKYGEIDRQREREKTGREKEI